MPSSQCPVAKMRDTLAGALSAGSETAPSCRSTVQALSGVVEAVYSGGGRPDHLDIIEGKAGELLAGTPDESCAALGRTVLETLRRYRDVFLAHIDVHYCPTGECGALSPAPCQSACPASVDAPSYVTLVGQGRYREALDVLREDLPFPGSLGRVCFHPCEAACRRGRIDAPISICRLKRTAFDKAREEGPPPPEPTPQRYREGIAVIGAGPAGLSAAYFLARKGYRPTVFEATSAPGGMLRWGIPDYRLPPEILDLEIDYIRAIGVRIVTDRVLGRDFTIDDLRVRGYEAVFLAVGAWHPIRLGIEGEIEFRGVMDCLDFLFQAKLGKAEVGRRVLVIGGGNAAVDCARTAMRLGAKEVHLVYRRTRKEMPASEAEIRDAEEEGVKMDFLLSPLRVIGKSGTVTGLECIRNVLSEPDASGRSRPVPCDGTQHILQADTIIAAIGQQVNPEPLAGVKDLDLGYKHLIVVDSATMETSLPGLFAGGDAVTGPATVIDAVAAGKRAAESIHRTLRGLPRSEFETLPRRRSPVHALETSPEEKSLSAPPTMPHTRMDARKNSFQEVELGLPSDTAAAEAGRCLRCDLCIACGRCVQVCGDSLGIDAIRLSYVSANESPETDFRRIAERCIGCGSCAENCPTRAITTEDRDGVRTLRMCGMRMSRHELIPCAACGSHFIAPKHLAYVSDRADRNAPICRARDLCPSCSRIAGAVHLAPAAFSGK